MKNMKISTRPAPSVEEARQKYTFSKNNSNQQNIKKKPPPRPPPPDFSKLKSRSAWNLYQQPEQISLIELSPPSSPKSTIRTFGGSISSSFSSSTSSLASSKRSFEFDNSQFNVTPWNTNPQNTSTCSKRDVSPLNPVVPQISVPTIIRARPVKKYTKTRNVPSRDTSPIPSTSGNGSSANYSPPMPTVPPPSPPKEVEQSVSPFGIAAYNFPGTQIGDLPLQVNDIVILLRRVNTEWLYGRIDDTEGIFPANFIDIQVPLPEADDRVVTALYEFRPQLSGDLPIIQGQVINVLHKISNDWLYGESNGQKGQFPANCVDRIPTTL